LRFYTEKFEDYYERKEKKNRKVKAKPRDGVVSGVEDGVQNPVHRIHNSAVTECYKKQLTKLQNWRKYNYLYPFSLEH